MANCDACSQPQGGKHPARTCTANLVEIAHPVEGLSLIFKPVPYDGAEGPRCPECRVVKGGDHHVGCDLEKCPICRNILNDCGCLADDELGYDDE